MDIFKKVASRLWYDYFLTTHYIEEAENVDYVVIMNEGRIEVEGTTDQLRTDYSKTILTLVSKDEKELLNILTTGSYPFRVEHFIF